MGSGHRQAHPPAESPQSLAGAKNSENEATMSEVEQAKQSGKAKHTPTEAERSKAKQKQAKQSKTEQTKAEQSQAKQSRTTSRGPTGPI